MKPPSSASLVSMASSSVVIAAGKSPARSSKSATMPRHIEDMTGRSSRAKPSVAAR